ncbi:MAG: 50S ribosomal protein L19 [Patescibacteria group bacterium]
MTTQTTAFKPITPEQIKPGMTIRVHQKIRDVTAKGEEKERLQIFEGIVLACRGNRGNDGTYTVRKISEGIGVEKIFPYRTPTVAKIEFVKQAKVRRAKLSYLRNYHKRLKESTTSSS